MTPEQQQRFDEINRMPSHFAYIGGKCVFDLLDIVRQQAAEIARLNEQLGATADLLSLEIEKNELQEQEIARLREESHRSMTAVNRQIAVIQSQRATIAEARRQLGEIVTAEGNLKIDHYFIHGEKVSFPLGDALVKLAATLAAKEGG